MLGEKIRELRNEKGLTQKDLADKLYVTAQAVSRWEKNEVEPSLKVLSELAKIFEVSIDELVTGESKEEEVAVADATTADAIVQQISSPAPTPTAPEKVVLGICEKCNKPIYDADDIVRIGGRGTAKSIYCKKCKQEIEQSTHNYYVDYSRGRRISSFIWGSIITVVWALITIFGVLPMLDGLSYWLAIISIPLVFTFSSCLILSNNFIGDMVLAIGSWGFVRFPGLIFGLDLDGIIWFLTVKLAFWIIGFVLATLCFILGVIVGMALSVFVYPFALVKSFTQPDETD